MEIWSAVVGRSPEDVATLTQLARLLGQEKQYDQAIDCWQKVQRHAAGDPVQHVEAQIEIAQLNLDAGRFASALDQFDEALDQLRTDSWRAADIRQRIETALLGQHDARWLIGYWQQRLERRPDDVEAMLRLAHALSAAGQQDAALQQSRRAVQRADGRQDVRQALIDQLLKAGSQAEALLEAETLAESFPGDPEVWQQLAALRLGQGTTGISAVRQRRAVDAWKRMAEIRPDDAAMALRVARLCRAQLPAAQPSDADRSGTPAASPPTLADHAVLRAASEDYYRQAVRRAPQSPEYRQQLGEFLHSAGRSDEAVEVWSQMITRDEPSSWHELATTYWRYGYRDQAVAAGARAVQLEPRNLDFRDQQIEWLLKTERHDQAWTEALRLQQLASDPVWEEKAIRRRVEVAAASGRIEQEMADLRQRVTDTAAAPADCWMLALLLAQQGNLSGATLLTEKALAAGGEDPRLLRSLADIAKAARRCRRRPDLCPPPGRSGPVQPHCPLQADCRTGAATRPPEPGTDGSRSAGRHGRGRCASPPAASDRAVPHESAPGGHSRLATCACEIDPGDLELRQELAQKLLEQGQASQAIDQLWRCLEQSQCWPTSCRSSTRSATPLARQPVASI